MGRWLLYGVSKFALWLVFRLGFGLEVRGQAHVPRRGAFLLASNHVSHLDPPVVGVACPRRLTFLARASLFDHALLGAFLRRLHPRASARNLETRLRWMLKETPAGSIGWRLDPAILNPSRTPDPPSRTWTALEAVRCPTLVVRGALSDILMRDMCELMVKRVPGSRWVEIPDAAHMVLEDNPAACAAAMLEFLATVPA